MMRILFAFVASMGLAAAFQVAPVTTRPITSLQMGLFDNMFQKPEPVKKVAQPTATSEPKKRKKKSDDWISNVFKEAFHGHGSAENELDEMYEAQQKMLQERRKLFGSDGHDRMHAKYQDVGVDHLRDIPLHEHDPATLNQMEDDAMYVDDNDKGFSFPWSNKFKP